MQTVIQVNKEQLEQITNYYHQFPSNKVPAGALFSVTTGSVTVTGYYSGKIMFQGRSVSDEVAKWQTNSSHKSKTTKKTVIGLPADFANWSVLGSDEVGAGAYFGPLTTAAVYVSKENLEWVRTLGIADSKTLTDDRMKKIAPQIISKLPHHVVNLMPEKYNQLQPLHNVNQMKAISHNFALGKVLDKIFPTIPQAILIDQFAQQSTYFNYLKKANQQRIIHENVYFTTKGEQYHLSVAAASILARVVELDAMSKLSAEAGIKLPIGAGREVDTVAAELLRRGIDLKHYAKLHFANTKKAERLL
ncbi:ribonuclease HIII [Leuconostoc suionicum]|uniref:ribonuclease HIII n=1 Tax=Leuconostoc suionicum TaxID=1511761 RepID=UPI0021A58FCF|nr:ribonuclease HIII [Leuconostoc suionicum]MCT4375812.1 ribonuclease HIII [Leuconostoc suionicum]